MEGGKTILRNVVEAWVSTKSSGTSREIVDRDDHHVERKVERDFAVTRIAVPADH